MTNKTIGAGMDEGVIDNELYERLVRKLMFAVINLKITVEKYTLSGGSKGRTFGGECPFILHGGIVG